MAYNVSDSFALVITAINDAPIVSAALENHSSIEDGNIDILLPTNSFSDIDGDLLSFSARLADGNILPDWLNFADGHFTGTPPVNFNGNIDIEIIADDGEFTASDIFTLTITPVNDIPMATIALADIQSAEDNFINFALPDNAFTDVDGDVLTLTAALADGSELPSWLSFDGALFTGTPPMDFNGALQLSVTASDGSLTVSDQFILTVEAVNDAPVATDDGGFISEDGNAISISSSALLANDNDIDGDALSILSVDNVVGGSAILDDNGQIIFTPDAGFSGDASFSYTATDGELSASANVMISVEASADEFADYIQGSEGRDFLFRRLFRPNKIFGAGGNDQIYGGFNNDQLAGGDGDDRLYGLWGNDIFWGGAGNDRIYGDSGIDTAHYYGLRSSYSLSTQHGNVTITDNQPNIDRDDGQDHLFSVERLIFGDGETISISAPIILDLDGNGVETISASQSSALYDLNGDGIADDTSWIGKGEGFLFLDRDGNGTVSNAGEFSFIDDVAGAASDLVGLRAFDSNGDGLLSSADEKFANFGVWNDSNGDGVADVGEISSLSNAKIASIGLNGNAVESNVAFGDVAVINTGIFTRTDGSTAVFADVALTYFEGNKESVESANADEARQVAAMIQDMATFGAKSGEGLNLRNGGESRPLDYFA